MCVMSMGTRGLLSVSPTMDFPQIKSLELSYAHMKAKHSLSTWLYLHSTGEKAPGKYEMGFQNQSSCFFITTPHVSYGDACALTLGSFGGL